MESRPTVIMPETAAAAGEAFEILASRYLSDVVGLDQLAAPFYTRLKAGRWVQFDGLFARRNGAQIVLEAKFHSRPVSLSTPGVAARVTFAGKSGFAGVVFVSRKGFDRDIMRARIPIEKVLVSWRGIRKRLSGYDGSVLTAGLDPVFRSRHGFEAASGAALVTGRRPRTPDGQEGFAFVETRAERWLRRLPASPCDVDLSSPPRSEAIGPVLDIVSAWTIEDSLRGFAPSRPQLLEWTLFALRDGPLDLMRAWRVLWQMGYRGRKGGLKNALENLCVMGLADKFRTNRGLFYGPLFERGRFDSKELLAGALSRWPAFGYFRLFSRSAGDKNVLAARLGAGFAHLGGYARSLYNPAKVTGLLALERHLPSATFTSRPS